MYTDQWALMISVAPAVPPVSVHRCLVSVPISATSMPHISAHQCPISAASLAHISEGEKTLIYKIL
ncbi:unnamed protein product [Staurois parvus]|uniref:Uncharacterized protein n=1 Tax=Staurois parvus TaxID=386267 RepID=A0ABN9HFV6_9NEOB|nr:unnamed protein product [Staurois parvus]